VENQSRQLHRHPDTGAEQDEQCEEKAQQQEPAFPLRGSRAIQILLQETIVPGVGLESEVEEVSQEGDFTDQGCRSRC
jgi:hypothetical protein